MSFGMKISKEGYDVTRTGDENLLYSSELASHSIFNIISASLSTGATSLTITHGLSYVPKVWIFMVGSDGDGTFYRRIPYLDETTYQLDYYITSSSIVIQSDGPPSRVDFKVIIFTRSPNP